MTREWSPDEVAAYHRQVQQLRAERDRWLVARDDLPIEEDDDATPVDP